MIDHEHADHPDFKCVLDVEYVGSRPLDEIFATERHALIYTDGYIALTMFECCYAIWSVRDGALRGGSLWKRGEWSLSAAARVRLAAFTPVQAVGDASPSPPRSPAPQSP